MKVENEDLVLQFREAISNIINNDPDFLHIADKKRLQDDKAFCLRFILAGQRDVERAIAIAKKALEWRKYIGVNDHDETTVKACELLSYESVFPYGRTKSGSHILMMRSKNHTKSPSPEITFYHQKCLAYVVEQMVMHRKVQRITFLMDCQDAGISNLDIDGIKYVITLFRDYYPYILDRIFVIELPWILQSTWKIVKTMLPAEAKRIVKMANKKELREEIDADNLPLWLGGTNEYAYHYKPGNPLGDFCPPVIQSS